MKSVIICDMEGVIETINTDGEKLFGYNNGSEWGVSHYRFVKPGG